MICFLDNQSAFNLFWAIGNVLYDKFLGTGVSPVRIEKPSASRLNSFAMNYLQLSQV